MSTDKMREDFEKSFTEMMMNERNSNDENVRHHLRRIGTYDMYGDRFTGAAWWAWQASRASIEVELPDPRETLAGPSLYAQFKESVEAAGVKVKK